MSKICIYKTLSYLHNFLTDSSKVFVVIDSNLKHLHNCFNGYNIIEIETSEQKKNLGTVVSISQKLLDAGADRGAFILGVGGGITTDIAGFTASIYKRGINFAFVPTTLLAQVDAAVGGKTGVNYDRYKNILGVIRQQEFTFICPQVLSSLPYREFTAGVAEMLKTFIIDDNGNYQKAVDVLSEMSQGYSILPEESAADYWSDCVAAYSNELMYLVTEAVRVKAGIVSRDQFEKGERRKLNLGHTFAHAIETLAQREERDISHGEAVAMGLVMAARLSDRVFRGDMDTPTEMEGGLAIDLCDCGLFPQCPYDVEDMAEIMAKDKKAEGGKVHFVLIREIGDVTSYALAVDEVVKLLK